MACNPKIFIKELMGLKPFLERSIYPMAKAMGNNNPANLLIL
jgi:hypothetical protein